MRPRKTEGPVRRDAIEVRPRKLRSHVVRKAYDVRRRTVRMAGSRTNSNAILQPELQLKPKRQFAAQTPICSPNANSQPIASLQPKRQFAYLKHFRSPNAFPLLQTHVFLRCCPAQCRACCQGILRCAVLKSPRQTRSGPANTAGPIVREACDVRS